MFVISPQVIALCGLGDAAGLIAITEAQSSIGYPIITFHFLEKGLRISAPLSQWDLFSFHPTLLYMKVIRISRPLKRFIWQVPQISAFCSLAPVKVRENTSQHYNAEDFRFLSAQVLAQQTLPPSFSL